MSSWRMYRALGVHMLKVWVLAFFAVVALYFIAPYIPRWLFVVLFFAFGLFVFLPAVFGVGPIGRVVGKKLNETAIAEARAEREGLAPRQPSSRDADG